MASSIIYGGLWIVTDKLRSYGVAHRELLPIVIHDNSQYANILLSTVRV
jgi:hypothetical protein